MKIIKILLLLTFGLWADFKLDVRNDVNVSQLENIVNNGWNDSNVTLNNWIVSNAERVMPEILEKIKKPVLKGEVTKDDFYPVSKILLTEDDYYFIVAYIKYLEDQGKFDEAKVFYIDIFKGFNNIEDLSFNDVIFRMAVEEIVVNSLSQSVERNCYSQAMKIELKNRIEKLLLLDTSKYFIGIEKEKQFILEASKLSFFRTPKEDTAGYTKFMTEVYKSLENHVNLYFSKMTDALKVSMKDNNKKAVDDFLKYMKEEKEEHLRFINKIHFILSATIVKIKNFLGLGGSDNSYMAVYVGKTTALVAVPLIESTYLDYVDFIEKNKKLLKQLESVQ